MNGKALSADITLTPKVLVRLTQQQCHSAVVLVGSNSNGNHATGEFCCFNYVDWWRGFNVGSPQQAGISELVLRAVMVIRRGLLVLYGSAHRQGLKFCLGQYIW